MKPLEHLDVILWGPQAPVQAAWKGGLQRERGGEGVCVCVTSCSVPGFCFFFIEIFIEVIVDLQAVRGNNRDHI